MYVFETVYVLVFVLALAASVGFCIARLYDGRASREALNDRAALAAYGNQQAEAVAQERGARLELADLYRQRVAELRETRAERDELLRDWQQQAQRAERAEAREARAEARAATVV